MIKRPVKLLFCIALVGSMPLSGNPSTSHGDELARNRAAQTALASTPHEAIYLTSPGGDLMPAASCAQADVQTAVDLAQEGDTVQVPAGNCSWSEPVAIHNKSVAVTGPGKAHRKPRRVLPPLGGRGMRAARRADTLLASPLKRGIIRLWILNEPATLRIR